MDNIITKQFYVLGTIIRLTVYGDNAQNAIDLAVSRLYEIDDRMSVFKADSEISNININAGKSPIKVNDDTFFVIKQGLYYSNLTSGAFNLCISPLVNLWGIGTSHARIPNEHEVEKALKISDYKSIVLNDKDYTVSLCHPGQAIDLGSIAKGYAADEIKSIFTKNNIKHAIIDLGGNVYAFGTKPDLSHWNIGIQDPFGDQQQYIGTLKVSNKSIVTSGGYERYFEIDGQRFQHIIDPKTGYPCKNDISSVTIISDNSIDGDALSTCCYTMGLEKGLNLIESINGVDGIFITNNKEVYMTSEITQNFKLI